MAGRQNRQGIILLMALFFVALMPASHAQNSIDGAWSLDEAIAQPHLVTALDLREIKADDPRIAKIAQLQQLRALSITRSDAMVIRQVLQAATACPLLDRLAITGNDLKTLPDVLQKLVGLRDLSLSYNFQLEAIPNWLNALDRLEILDLSGNEQLDYQAAMRGILKMATLSTLILNDFPGDSLQLPLLPQITRLSFIPNTSSGPRELPFSWPQVLEELSELPNLRDLDISGGDYRLFGEGVHLFTQLKVLNLAHTEMRQADWEALLGSLQKGPIQSLIVSDNPSILHIPKSIRGLRELEELQAADCAVVGVDPGIGKLKQLRVLNLANQSECTQISDPHAQNSEVDCTYFLQTLPKQLRCLKKLERLDVRGNAELDREAVDGLKKKRPDCEVLE